MTGDDLMDAPRRDEATAADRVHRGDYLGAAAALRRASAAYAGAGAYDDAIRVCRMRVELQPNDVEGRLELARMYALRDGAPVAVIDDLVPDEPLEIVTGEPVEIVVEAVEHTRVRLPEGRAIDGLDRGPADLYLSLDELPEIPLFDAFSPTSRAALLQNVELIAYPPGATISSPSEPLDHLCVIHRGTVAARRYDATGYAVELMRLHVGEFFGEFALLGGRPPGAWFQATDAVQVLAVSGPVVELITEFHPGFADTIAGSYANRMLDHLMAHAALFVDLSFAERARVARQFQRVSYRAGDTVLRRGTVNGRLFYVVGGALRIVGGVDGGDIAPGQLFGFQSALFSVPLDTDVVCISDAIVLVLGEEAVSSVIAPSRALAATMVTSAVTPTIMEVAGEAI